MLLLISPAKKLDFESVAQTDEFTLPDFLTESQQLIDTLTPYCVEQLGKLMSLSVNLSELNFQRYKDWHTPFTTQNAKQAISTFKGDVYTGMNIESFDNGQLEFAQQHLRILSGLYGLLRPLDLMQPYRLEMGTRLENMHGKNLYAFWGATITTAINKQLKSTQSAYLINLASVEYFKSVKPKLLDVPIITPIFKELRQDKAKGEHYKIISLLAKRARGMMSAYILKNKLENIEDIKNFDEAGYIYNEELSQGDSWVFTRDSQPGK
jgi:cytoplasmic iron level regulating protein YaaA (DUF328/UPF0246 family)